MNRQAFLSGKQDAKICQAKHQICHGRPSLPWSTREALGRLQTCNNQAGQRTNNEHIPRPLNPDLQALHVQRLTPATILEDGTCWVDCQQQVRVGEGVKHHVTSCRPTVTLHVFMRQKEVYPEGVSSEHVAAAPG